MSIKGFVVNGQTLKYDYNALDNKPSIPSGGSGLTDEIKTALLQLASKVAYIDADGNTYYQDLYDALYTSVVTLTSISAVYTQTGTVYDTDSLDSLRSGLVVIAYYSNNTSQIVTEYTLAGTLSAGVSTITVIYQGKTTTFNVTVTAAPSTFSVTNSLTNCTNSNGASKVTEWASYSGTLSCASDYTITTVSVTMGGIDVTGTAYSSGTISIANVTGNIVITAVATQRQATLSSISAVFTQGQNVIYDTDSLDTLKQYLVVTATWSDSSSSTVAAADYTLSGSLTVGTSTITVSYGGKTTTFTVVVSADTTVKLARTGVVLAHYSTAPIYRDYETEYGGVTVAYTLNSPTTTLYPAGIIPTTGNTMYAAPASFYILDANDNVLNFVGMAQKTSPYFYRWAQDANGTMTEYSQTWTVSEYSKIQCSVDTRYIDDAYMYDKTTGQVWFAGKNTPYFGMNNISEAS